MGVAFALIALFAWAGGDFLIQRSTRKFGVVVPLFYITAAGSVFLLPFVYGELASVSKFAWGVLLVAGGLITLVAFLSFEALRRGKISVIEPIMAFELPVTAVLSFAILGERISLPQLALLAVMIIGIFLVSTRKPENLKRLSIERGVTWAIIATVVMGTVNFSVSLGARESSPLIVHWFTSSFIAAICLGYLVGSGRMRELARDWRLGSGILAGVTIVDNIAWIAYSYAVTLIPIAIATGISESYIALAALLGLTLNREKLGAHQLFGLFLCIGAVAVLAIIS